MKTLIDVAETMKPRKKTTNRLIESMQTKNALTHNGAITNESSLNHCLDLFSKAGASRNISEADIQNMFSKAYNEDSTAALRIMFWARDVREGAGERRFFRICLQYLQGNQPEVFKKITKHIPEFGRWDDVLYGDIDEASEMIEIALASGDALCAKWMPREKSSKRNLAYALRKQLRLSPKQYRTVLANFSKTVEQEMSDKEWGDINYSHVPSMALNKYRNAFQRNDNDRFNEFNQKAIAGKVKVNAGAIFPQNIFSSWSNGGDSDSINAQWQNLPNYTTDEMIIPVCDVSGSMSGLPMEVSVSLGVYLSERNTGPFKDAFVTFSSNPELQVLKGSATERFLQLKQANWRFNTNLQATMDLLLNKGIENNLSQAEMPSKILLISDMEFDYCGQNTNQEVIDAKFEAAGYKTPGIVFWNVNGRTGNSPVNKNNKNVALVSGFSPAILTSVLGGDDLTPMGVMNKTINKERYNKITT